MKAWIHPPFMTTVAVPKAKGVPTQYYQGVPNKVVAECILTCKCFRRAELQLRETAVRRL